MTRYVAGVVAGFAATIVLSTIMVIKASMGVMPGLDVIALLSAVLGNPGVPLVGWIVHFAVGTVLWGLLFAIIYPSLPGPFWLRGAVFSIGAWLAMMVVLMPIAGKGLFATATGMGPMVAIATLVLHLVYGIVLGAVFGALVDRRVMTAPA